MYVVVILHINCHCHPLHSCPARVRDGRYLVAIKQLHRYHLIKPIQCQDFRILCSFDGQKQRLGFTVIWLIEVSFYQNQNQTKPTICDIIFIHRNKMQCFCRSLKTWEGKSDLEWNANFPKSTHPRQPWFITQLKKKRPKTSFWSRQWTRASLFLSFMSCFGEVTTSSG